jgi:hypothetical protein
LTHSVFFFGCCQGHQNDVHIQGLLYEQICYVSHHFHLKHHEISHLVRSQLLKRNRKQMMSWLEDMASTDRSSIIKKARKGGRTLRELHINNEKSVISTVHEEMMKPRFVV